MQGFTEHPGVGHRDPGLSLGLLPVTSSVLRSQPGEISFCSLKQCQHADCSEQVRGLKDLKMLNWFMELTSLKNLSRCEKGSWFKSPAASLSPQTRWGATSGLGCDWEVARQPLEGKGFLGAAAASWVHGQDGFAPGKQPQRLMKTSVTWGGLSAPALALGSRKRDPGKMETNWSVKIWSLCFCLFFFPQFLLQLLVLIMSFVIQVVAKEKSLGENIKSFIFLIR